MARGERGIALPVAMLVLLLALVLAAAASLSALSATDTSGRDVRAKRAVSAAEAGLDAAIGRANAVSIDLANVLDLTQQCVASTTGVLSRALPGVGGWCEPVTEDLGNGASYEYQVSPVTNLLPPLSVLLVGDYNGLLSRKIVATGKADCPGPRCVTRRLYTEVNAVVDADGISLILVKVLNNLDLRLYERKAETFRECTPAATNPSVPDSGC